MSADPASELPPMPAPTIVVSMIAEFDILAKLAGTRKIKAVAAWCARNRIQTFRDTKHRPCTTITAIDRALDRGGDADNEPNYAAAVPPPRRKMRP